jgi:hypothetical protein
MPGCPTQQLLAAPREKPGQLDKITEVRTALPHVHSKLLSGVALQLATLLDFWVMLLA